MKKPDVGLLIPIITMFNEDESINDEEIRKHIDFLFENDVHGLLCGGTCTEFSSMDLEERMHVHEVVVKHTAGRGPVFIGVACPGTKDSIKLAKHAEEIGAFGIFAVAPYYMLPTVAEIKQYYRDVAHSVSLPFLLYNNPGLSGVGLSVADIAELTNEGTAQYVKECYGDPARIQDLKLMCNEEISIIYGEDYGAFQGLLLGANGWTAGCANFIPKECVELWKLLKENGDYPAALKHWYKILPALNMTSKKDMYGKNGDERPDFIQIYREALKIRGLFGGVCRKPLLPIDDDDIAYLKELMEDLGYK
ncbi:MAG: dihydrodipicolinate synthase family protein [Lentihominibacter sp.]|jgi:dihydrodipicolinate synthase/N-acetylneuraminate lyase